MTIRTALAGLSVGADGSATVDFERTYATTAEDLRHAVTDPERLARWFAPVEGDLRVGGCFAVRFDDGDVADCRVTACDPPQSFSFEWPHGEHASLVTVRVEPQGGRARLRLTHTRLTRAQAAPYATGWHVYLDHLAAVLVGRAVPTTWGEEFDEALAAYADALAG